MAMLAQVQSAPTGVDSRLISPLSTVFHDCTKSGHWVKLTVEKESFTFRAVPASRSDPSKDVDMDMQDPARKGHPGGVFGL
jgi:hypothetical protein